MDLQLYLTPDLLDSEASTPLPSPRHKLCLYCYIYYYIYYYIGTQVCNGGSSKPKFGSHGSHFLVPKTFALSEQFNPSLGVQIPKHCVSTPLRNQVKKKLVVHRVTSKSCNVLLRVTSNKYLINEHLVVYDLFTCCDSFSWLCAEFH